MCWNIDSVNSSINTARSALSAFLSLGYKDSLGEHPLIERFMKGVFNQGPALPRYQNIWDVNIVLEYLASLSPVNVLSFSTLTLKFVMLLFFTFGTFFLSVKLCPSLFGAPLAMSVYQSNVSDELSLN